MEQSFIPSECIEVRIFLFRGVKVMFARDLALLYGVETRVLNQAVSRNRERFPDDFMFQLTTLEEETLRSQFVISKSERGGIRYAPYAFTEQGVAMLSSVLKSERAIMINIQIIRAFTRLREMVSEQESLRFKLEGLEKRFDEQFKVVFDALRRIMVTDETPKSEIGFRVEE
ncbi:ORF6N domain-containing protein [Patescibacteria group bacterium]|nr:ORF6N domain-containing protein [Patescibacteria group bacterium]MBP9709884.1 ORF6N domain-containing protein [Patescibacteria group bacterium]